jgi:hypothetical protein
VVAAVSFAGTGLHSIVGIQHGPDRGASVHQTLGVGALQVVADEQSCDEAGCPICNYLAQAKVAGEYFAIVVCSLSVGNDNVPSQVAVPAADLRPFEARGPPAAV